MTRVDIIAAKGTEELLDEAFYALAGGLWVKDEATSVRITCYPADPGRLLAYLREAAIETHSVTETEEEAKDYAAEVRKHFTPVRIGGLTILPPWRRPGKKGRTIVIEPGMAFGTGRHESTKLMAAMMEHVRINGRTVLDIGSGSGILAINALLLGASRVAAIDHDPLAAEAMKKSCDLNGRPCILLACADMDAVKGHYDVVLANLDFSTFERRAHDVASKVAPGGCLLVSGIEAQHADKAPDLFAPLVLAGHRKMKEWHGFIFKRGGLP
jgi:ribosomal protein L11 methyltransferase